MWPYNLLRDAGLNEHTDIDSVFCILPNSQTRVLKMFYEKGMNEEEIGQKLNISPGRVKKTREKALFRITESFSDLRKRLSQIRCFVLDMDGTIYLSNRLFPFTKAFLHRLEETGRHYCFFTNNSSRNRQDYVDKLNGMGISAAPDQVFLSTQVIIEEMQRLHPQDSFFIVGTPNLENAFREAGLRVINRGQEVLITEPQDRPVVVILGFDMTLTYEKISKACKYIRHGAAYYGVNMDYNCPVDDNGVIDYIPDCGSIARLVERSTGRFPDFYGKPSRHALEHVIRHTGFAEDQLAFVGDRIYTDIAIANGTKALSIMVLTGETQRKDLDQYDYRPDFIIPSLEELIQLL